MRRPDPILVGAIICYFLAFSVLIWLFIQEYFGR
jgi:hypothetical protein